MPSRFPIIVILLAATSVLAARDLSEKLYSATRKDNAVKVARILENGVSAQTRLVALSVSVSRNAGSVFDVLWGQDNSDLSSDSLDYVLCYAYRTAEPRSNIQAVLDERSLTIDGCCQDQSEQPYCARRPIRLVEESFPATECTTVFIEEDEVPSGATRIATVWDEKISVLNPTESAKYGLPRLTKRGARGWALELCPTLGAIGADAVLITKAERLTSSESSVDAVQGPAGASVTGVQLGAVKERIEVVALRTLPRP